jgi:glycosyltransferase involved in cell wall biosynthesis
MKKIAGFLSLLKGIIETWSTQLIGLKKGRKLNVLFLVRRYHTNMIPMVESLIESGHKVAVMVVTREVIEDYSVIEPIELTSLHGVKNACESLPFKRPDLILIREKSEGMIAVCSMFHKKGARVVHYDQKPLRRQPGWKNLITDLKRLRAAQIRSVPLLLVTPVDHVISVERKLPKKILTRKFNFPVATPNIINVSIQTARNSWPIRVLMVGKLAQPRKRHFWTIAALESSGVPCALTICGAGNDSFTCDDGTRSNDYYISLYEKVQEFAESRTLSIRILENRSFNEMHNLYLASDIFALPSEAEHFSISVLEAMAHGCATISSDSNGSAHHITHNVDGLIFKESSFEDFESCVHKLLKQNELRHSFQHAAQLKMQLNHNYRQFAQFIESLV